MRQSERDKRNYLIIGLCAVLVVMAVGFAAFSQQLQINGTSEVTSTWDVHIKEGGVSYKNAVDATSTQAEKTSNLVATFACSLITPGKSTISYDVVVENKGSLNAKLDSINLTGGNTAISVVTSPTNASLSTNPIVLAPNDETTITVIVSYNDINTQPTGAGLSTNITAQLNFSQTNDSPAADTTKFTGAIYRNSEEHVNFGDSIVSESETKWCDIETSSGNQYDCFDTEPECNAFLSDNGYTETDTCQQKTVTTGVGEYTTDASTLNKTYYLKHDVIDDIITASYACLVINNTEYCMKSSTDGSTWAANKALLGTLKDAGTITCSEFNDSRATCSGGGIDNYLYASDDGEVHAGPSYSVYCIANDDGVSWCYE